MNSSATTKKNADDLLEQDQVVDRTLVESQFIGPGRPTNKPKPQQANPTGKDIYGNRLLEKSENIFDIVMPWKHELPQEIVPPAMTGSLVKGAKEGA